jgi:hypothetical protein
LIGAEPLSEFVFRQYYYSLIWLYHSFNKSKENQFTNSKNILPFDNVKVSFNLMLLKLHKFAAIKKKEIITMSLLIKNIKQLIGISEKGNTIVKGKSMAELSVIENAFLYAENDCITAYGTMEELSSN